jgi:hypothetical protein
MNLIRITLFSILVLLVTACAEEIPSHSVTLLVVDDSTSPVLADTDTPLSDVSISANSQSNDEEPEDVSKSATTGSDGRASLTLGETLHSIDLMLDSHMSASVFVNVGTADLDLTDFPVILPAGAGNNNDCHDVLNVDQQLTGETSGAWVRVYKAGLTSDDTLTIVPVGHSNAVGAGADLADGTTAPAPNTITNVNYIDVYEDSITSGDTLGHKNTAITGNTTAGPELTYRATLNGESIEFTLGSCNRGGYTIIMF